MAESLEFSAFTSVLKVVIGTENPESVSEINSLLKDVLVQNSCLTSSASFDALVKSLKGSDGDALRSQLSFLDNCLTRLTKKPVLYLDAMENLLGGRAAKASALLATISEQWPFVVKAGNQEKEAAVAGWIASFLGLLKGAGEDDEALTTVRGTISDATENKSSRSALKKAFKKTADGPAVNSMEETGADLSSRGNQPQKRTHVDLIELFGKLPTEVETHVALHKWEREDIEEALEHGTIGDLLIYLCSEHEEIRRQAYMAIGRFMAKLKVCQITFKILRTRLLTFGYRTPRMRNGKSSMS